MTRARNRGICSRPKCGYVTTNRGLCHKHYDAWRVLNRPVDASLVAAHVRALRDAGYGLKRIKQLTGVSVATLDDLAAGRTRRTFRPTAEALFALRPGGDQLPARIPVIGVQRRLRALVALGYTDEQIAAEIGGNQSNLSRYVGGRIHWITPEKFLKVDLVFRRLESQPAPTGWPAERARRRAATRGWLPPFAWDEGTLDDPAAEPAAGSVPVNRRPRLADVFAEQYRDLRDHVGLDDAAIAERLGITEDALDARKRRLGIPTVAMDDDVEAVAS